MPGLSLIAGLLAVFLVIVSMPNYPIAPCGVVLPKYGQIAQSEQASSTKSIALYDVLSSPANARSMGVVTVMYHTKTHDESTQAIMTAKLTQLAHDVGGDAIEIRQFFFIPKELPSGPAVYLKGTVLKLPKRAQ
jgi:hypothetical protein